MADIIVLKLAHNLFLMYNFLSRPTPQRFSFTLKAIR